jgi:hypothetical protein
MNKEYKEEWVEMPETNGAYKVSNAGRFMSTRTGRILKAAKGGYNKKYLFVQLMVNGDKKKFYCHRTSAKYFVDNPDNKPQVNHEDGDTFNNWFWNLSWATHQENQLHAARTGLIKTCVKTTISKDGEIVGEFYSISEAARFLNYKVGSLSKKSFRGYDISHEQPK